MSQVVMYQTAIAPGSFVQTLTGNSGGAISPSAGGNINILGSGIVSVAGNAGTNTLTISITNPIPIANGGTNATSFATTDGTVYFDGTRLVTTVTGSAGQVLTSGGAGVAPAYASLPASSISITGDSGGAQVGAAFSFTGSATGLTFAGAADAFTLGGVLVVSNGGTGRATLTNHGLLVGAGTAAITQLADAANGQLPIGFTGADPVLATITAGAGISVTNGAGSITISNTGAGFTWFDVVGGSATLAAQSGYIADAAGLTTFTMPTNNTFGDTIKVVGKGAGGWKIVYGAGQNIIFGSSASTATTGNIASTNAHDCVEMVCTTASVTAPIFTVVSAVGNISIT